MTKTALLFALASLAGAASAEVVSYDASTNFPTNNYSLKNGCVFGQAITLATPGILSSLSFSILNPSASPAQTMLTGIETVSFYDNTTPYVSGSLTGALPLLGSVTFNIAPNLTTAAFKTYNDMAVSSGFYLPANVFMTTKYTPLTGTATTNGIGLILGSSTVGTNSTVGFYMFGSPYDSSNVYEGTYFDGQNFNEYLKVSVQAVPEPASLAALGLGAVAALRRRRIA